MAMSLKDTNNNAVASSNAIDHAWGPMVKQNQNKATATATQKASSNAKLPVAKKARLDDNKSKKSDATAKSPVTTKKPRTKSMARRGE